MYHFNRITMIVAIFILFVTNFGYSEWVYNFGASIEPATDTISEPGSIFSKYGSITPNDYPYTGNGYCFVNCRFGTCQPE